MVGFVPMSWLEWGLAKDGDRAPRLPDAYMLAAHDVGTTNSRKA